MGGACSTVANSSGAHVYLNRTQGGCVLFHAAREAGAELKEISWGFGPESDYRVILTVCSSTDPPTWVSLQDKYEQRVHVPNMTSLRIDNLTPGDSGQYRARISFTGGKEFNMNFHLTVYAPVPLPQIWVTSSSITAGWCNVTLECRAQGAMEDLKVTWESKGLPEELEQRGTPGPAPNSWTLDLSLPLSQPNPRLTCVLSNPLDQKTATTDLGAICVPGGSSFLEWPARPEYLGNSYSSLNTYFIHHLLWEALPEDLCTRSKPLLCWDPSGCRLWYFLHLPLWVMSSSRTCTCPSPTSQRPCTKQELGTWLNARSSMLLPLLLLIQDPSGFSPAPPLCP
ncbi:SLAM family member 9-like isoform X4 [Manis pentadactyla]|uniref:SLAM family member 9-like isoform X4 n=1 Tax=Manis pentadactyla TaxID=143292 RepID=UPI00255CB34F|nr:SLAM family member 9-like isoform X4 [Manis pentadactyla]